MPQVGIDLLRGDRGCRQRYIHTNGSSRAHGVGRIANEHHAIARPVLHQDDLAFKREEGFEVLETCGKLRKDRIETTHMFSHCGNTSLLPVSPLPCRECKSRLNMVGLLWENEPSHICPKRDVYRIRPVWRLLDGEPYDTKVVSLSS